MSQTFNDLNEITTFLKSKMPRRAVLRLATAFGADGRQIDSVTARAGYRIPMRLAIKAVSASFSSSSILWAMSASGPL